MRGFGAGGLPQLTGSHPGSEVYLGPRVRYYESKGSQEVHMSLNKVTVCPVL